ncbi:MAG TPA: hypothetical protein VML54_17435 [Candidatus Limnocylindrales bacterium]|nr:hypothetical protein [Candidatus Limnocylindrales bacterium]
MTVYFSGADPIDPETGIPTGNLNLAFKPITTEYETQEKEGEVKATVAAAWEPSKRGGAFKFEAADPQAVLDAVKVQVFEDGQAVADVTEYIAAASGTLFFNPNLKLWELRLGFTGVILPSGIVTPSMLKTIGGSAVATLTIDQTEITTRIRENEFSTESAELVLKAETRIQDAGSESVQEVFALHTNFMSNELNPLGAVDVFLKLNFEINFAGVVGPPCLQFAIPADAWVQGDGGGFKIEAPDPQAAGINFLVLQNGQVVADLTDRIATLSASLRYDIGTKSWDLTLEIAGIVTPSDIHVPLFAPLAGARTGTLDIGNGLEMLSARLRESEATY